MLPKVANAFPSSSNARKTAGKQIRSERIVSVCHPRGVAARRVRIPVVFVLPTDFQHDKEYLILIKKPRVLLPGAVLIRSNKEKFFNQYINTI